jgi:hypothetical protein
MTLVANVVPGIAVGLVSHNDDDRRDALTLPIQYLLFSDLQLSEFFGVVLGLS